MSHILQQKGWPYLTWDSKELSCLLGEVRHRQGRLAGKTDLLGNDLKNETLLNTLVTDIVKSAELEGEYPDADMVRIAVASRLKLNMKERMTVEPSIDRIAQVTTDILLNYRQPVTEQRIFNWKKLLNVAPDNHVGYRDIAWPESFSRTHDSQFYVQDTTLIPNEMKRFIQWFNTAHPTDPVIKAGVTHLRFTFIHPFEDNNGRIARNLTDLLLTRADNSSQRLFSLSSQICKQKDMYYHVLQLTRKGSLDITDWLRWFLSCFGASLIEAENQLTHILEKSKFWEKYRLIRLNERQVKMINMLWDGMDGKITSSMWANMNICSPDTALRDIQDLINKKILYKKDSGGRSTAYALN